jgi:hypothetical protein
MHHFNEYLQGKQFILYINHKPLEKLGHLHSNTMKLLQTALLEHDFIIQYKKGSNMLADYLSRLPATPEVPIIAAFDLFQSELIHLQAEDDIAKEVTTWQESGKWPPISARSKSVRIWNYSKNVTTTKMALPGSG